MTRAAKKQRRKPRISAATVVSLLAEKHSEDVFVPECKDGPSWTSNAHRRLDAWAMKRTWSPPTTIGYEVKVSRADWLQDQKVGAYLGLCHQLYIVAPDGVVEDDELPKDCGFIHVSAGGLRLITRWKAPYRAIEWPGELMAYVLMSRARIKGEDESTGRNRLEFWKEWLRKRDESCMIGGHVSRALSERFRREVDEVKTRVLIAEKQTERIREMAAKVKSRMGIDIFALDGWSSESMAQRFEERLRVFSPELVRAVSRASEQLASALELIKASTQPIGGAH